MKRKIKSIEMFDTKWSAGARGLEPFQLQKVGKIINIANFSLVYSHWDQVRTTFEEYDHVFEIPEYSTVISILAL